MAKNKIENLLSQLHDTFGDDEPSKEVVQLMMDIEQQLEPAKTPPDILETAKSLLTEVESDHPQAAAVARQIIEILNNMGI